MLVDLFGVVIGPSLFTGTAPLIFLAEDFSVCECVAGLIFSCEAPGYDTSDFD